MNKPPPQSYRQVFAQSPVPMFLFDPESRRVLDVNAAAATAFGSSPEQLLSMTVEHLPQSAGLKVALRPIGGAAVGMGVVTGAAEQAPSESLLRELNEQLVLSGLREQSSREEAERANAVKDEFLAVISHELRTPLQAMLGWVALLRGGKLKPADAAHGLVVIERNARLQAALVADLLDVSRAVKGKLRLDTAPLDLRTLAAQVTESLRVEAEKKGVGLELGPAGGPVVVQGDASRLQQVLVNLLANALKFSERGGMVRVDVAADGALARLRVGDTGEGFEPEFAPLMFEPFSQESLASTRMHGGLGLGLMIVRHLVEAHGGTVRAESAGKGAGAAFIVDLPLAAGVSTEPAAAAPAQDGDMLAGLQALVVEDHPDSREFVSTVLRQSGAEVRHAGSAREALDLLAAQGTNVVVSDLAMPDMDGYGLLRALRQRGDGSRDVPVIALSAFAGLEERDRALAAGFCAYAAKPVDPAELVRAVARAAGRIAA